LKKSYHFIILIILLFFSLTGTKFINNFNPNPSRTFDNLWDLGHLILFLYLNYFLISLFPGLKNKSLLTKILLLFGVTTIIGLGIEIFQQLFMNGKVDIKDMANDYIGALLAYLFFWKQQHEIIVKRIIIILIAVLLIFELHPVAISALDELQSHRNFPILADFESETELERFKITGMPLQVSSNYSSHGLQSMKIEFIPRLYSTLSIEYFLEDWTGYSYLKFDIYNPSDSLIIICRINDSGHRDHNNAFDDRFNKKIILTTGWNNISIDLNEVVNAPAIRKMNMQHIRNWAIFTVKLKESRTIYLDHLRLE
jgi:VanZ family protein